MVLLSPSYTGAYELWLNHLPNIAHSLELVLPEFDPDLFAKSSFFVLCSPFFCRNNQKIYRSCLRGLFNKKGLTSKPISFDVSIISGDIVLHLSQNLPVVREALERASLNRQIFLRLGWERVVGFMVNFDWEEVTYFKRDRDLLLISGRKRSNSFRMEFLRWNREVNKDIDNAFQVQVGSVSFSQEHAFWLAPKQVSSPLLYAGNPQNTAGNTWPQGARSHRRV